MMRGAIRSTRGFGMAGLLVLAALVCLPLLAQAQSGWRPLDEDEFFLVLSDGTIVHPDDKSIKQNLPNRPPDTVLTESGLTYRIFYSDANGTGFFAPNNVGELRQIRYEEALAYVARVLNVSGTLDVLVDASLNQNNGILAFGGTLFSSTPGYQNGTAFTRIQNGTKPAAGRPEIFLQVNFGSTYNITSGAPSNSELDFQSVLMHEVLHAMGFLSLANSSGASDAGAGAYSVYDSLMFRQTGNVQMFPLSMGTPTFGGVAGDLVSNDLIYSGAQATAEFGGNPPLFSPANFLSGSSLSHWRTGSIPNGGAVMEHAFAAGEIIRQFPRFEAAALRDLGWNNVNLNNLQRGPTADFIIGDSTVNVNEAVQFTDTSRSGSQPVTTWLWNFGDGQTSGAISPSHAYATAGTFNVRLTVTTANGSDQELKNNAVTVTGTVNTNFTATPQTGNAPLQVQFTDTTSTGGLAVTSRTWNFGDGTTSTEANPLHTYNDAGSFTVSLSVTAGGATDTETKTSFITVTAVEPTGCGCNGAKAGEGGEGEGEGDSLVAAAALGLIIVASRRRKR
ncbi:MAG: PKD domain-containing protein [Candidatus Hydrogenedens sp.]|nr:PKD domain-containing protein [Candidatus Hydrogenedens sp.]